MRRTNEKQKEKKCAEREAGMGHCSFMVLSHDTIDCIMTQGSRHSGAGRGAQWHATTRRGRAMTRPARARDTTVLRAGASGSARVSWFSPSYVTIEFLYREGEAAFMSRHGSSTRDTTLRHCEAAHTCACNMAVRHGLGVVLAA